MNTKSIVLFLLLFICLLLLCTNEQFRQLKDNECSICYEELDSENKQIEQICSATPLHKSHISCIRQYSRTNSNASCPMCKLLDTINSLENIPSIPSSEQSLEEETDLKLSIK